MSFAVWDMAAIHRYPIVFHILVVVYSAPYRHQRIHRRGMQNVVYHKVIAHETYLAPAMFELSACHIVSHGLGDGGKWRHLNVGHCCAARDRGDDSGHDIAWRHGFCHCCRSSMNVPPLSCSMTGPEYVPI